MKKWVYINSDIKITEIWETNPCAPVASSGNVTDEVIAQYIQLQDIAERARDDEFTVGS